MRHQMQDDGTKMRSGRAVVVVGTAIVVLFLFMNWYLLDGVIGYAWTAIGAAPAEFAVGYSSRSFRTIKIGMSETDLRRTLGAPFSITLRYPGD